MLRCRVEGTWSTVFLQYIRNPGYFVIHYEEDIAKVKQLSAEISIKCDSRPPRPASDKHLQPGQFIYLLIYFLLPCADAVDPNQQFFILVLTDKSVFNSFSNVLLESSFTFSFVSVQFQFVLY